MFFAIFAAVTSDTLKNMGKNVAIVMAAGQGTRVGSSLPKQFIPIRGKMLVEFSLSVFQQHPLIQEIVMTVPAGFEMEKVDFLKNKYKRTSGSIGIQSFRELIPRISRNRITSMCL